MANDKQETPQQDTAAIVQAVLETLGPILEKVALTPERINEIKKPYVDPAKEARNKREGERMRAEDAGERLRKKQEQDRCSHLHPKNRQTLIRTIDNFWDGKVRGICHGVYGCGKFIQPEHWEIDAYNNWFKVPADKDYSTVLEIDAAEVGDYSF